MLSNDRFVIPPLLTNVSALPGETWTQEIVSFHARRTVQLLQQETIQFISPDLWPRNSLDLIKAGWLADLGLASTRRSSATPTTWSSTSLTHGGERRRRSHWPVQNMAVCMWEGKRSSLWTFVTGSFTATEPHNTTDSFQSHPHVPREDKCLWRTVGLLHKSG